MTLAGTNWWARTPGTRELPKPLASLPRTTPVEGGGSTRS